MFKKTLLSVCSACICMSASAQTPKFGVDPLDKVISAMTLDEKLDVLIGSSGNQSTDANATIGNASELVPGAAGQLNGVPRLGIPSTVVADGPAGLRIQPKRQGTDKTFYCTHFPVAMLMSATWNTQLVKEVGAAMGNEVKHYGVDVLLAPATNIHRNPLNGRNFEYYSEDPLLAGNICAAMVGGVQSNGVGTSLKHFALNNQETNRTSNNVIGTPRTFREIYLKPFEIVVKQAQPWTVMTSYNKVNGTMTSERCDLVTEILRHEWGFKGMVMTDWFGGQNAVAQMEAGNDLLMPGKVNQREEIRKAVLNGRLSMEIIDRNVRHILEYILKTPRYQGYTADNNPDLKAHAVVTRNAALEGMVLLKNAKNALPVSNNVKNVAVFGRTSYDFIAGGTGSGDVNHAYVVSLIEGLNNAGFTVDPALKKAYEAYIPEAQAKMPKSTNQFAAFLPKHLIPEMNLSASELQASARNNDVALITIGKTSGEFADRYISDNFNLTRLGAPVGKLKQQAGTNDIFAKSLALVDNNGTVVLEFGLVKKALTAAFDISAEVYFADINWTLLMKKTKKHSVNFTEISKFPAVSRDLALLVDKSVEFARIEQIAFAADKKFLKKVTLFDVYEGKNLEVGKKSYAVNFL